MSQLNLHPFIYFETSFTDDVLNVNNRFIEEFNIDELNYPLHNIFDVWKIQGNGVVSASSGTKNYIFLKTQSHNKFFYIGIASDDLTDSIVELEKLRRLTRHLDAVIENSYDGIYITDSEGVTLRTNSAIERITGIPKEYYINKKVDDLVKRGILEDSVTRKVIEQKRTISHVQQNYSGQETLLTGNPVFNEYGDIESVVTNIRDLSDLNNLQTALRNANQLNKSYRKEIERLKRSTFNTNGLTIIKDEQMRLVYETAKRILDVSATVLLLGETGVGKDVLANYIYSESKRKKSGKFIKVNCGAIPPNLLETELFGYSGGAFTGAAKEGKPGMFELADKGVLFLDEIGEMPIELQVKLLRVIQEKEVQRVGGTFTKKIDVRLVAATNKNLKEMVREGKFREDLFYRINVVPIAIPPLRVRKMEILSLSKLFLDNLNKKYDMKKTISDELNSFFYRYEWPGNIRELSNLLEQIVLLNSADHLGIEHLPEEYKIENELPKSSNLHEDITLKEAVEIAEKKILEKAIKRYDTTYEIAKALNTSQATIVRRLAKYGISTGM